MSATKQVYIYTRFSNLQQREVSCEDQERIVRRGLAQLGIDLRDVKVVHDKAIPGSRDDRHGFQEVMAMAKSNQVAVVAVDEQSRFSRSGNASAFIQDLVFYGARFISISEGIDTARGGWKLPVKVLEIGNEQATEHTAHRVRRGMEGRVLDDGSAGDFPYGYESYFIDPDAALRSLGRGPKPKKSIRIREEHALWVRQIFQWFTVERKSITQIAKDLNANNAPRRERERMLPWRVYAVREILINAKYIAIWPWGKLTTIRNSHGKTKYVPVADPQSITTRIRADLRIIDDQTWQAAQARLAYNRNALGRKPGQKPRGWYKGRGSDFGYPLSGLIVCGRCGHMLYRNGSGDNCSMYCPRSRNDECDMKISVNVLRAESALIDYIGAFVHTSDEWLDRTLERTHELVRAAIDRTPAELAAVELEIRDTDSAASELVKQLANIGPAKDLVRRELDKLAITLNDLRQRREQLQASTVAPESLPDTQWFRDQLKSLPKLCKADPGRLGHFLRQMMGTVQLHPVVMPGKIRGYTQLRFRIQPWQTLLAVGDGRIPTVLANIACESDDSESPEVIINIGGPTKSDRLRPIVAELRQQGLTIPQIAKQLGEKIHNIEAYSRPRRSRRR